MSVTRTRSTNETYNFIYFIYATKIELVCGDFVSLKFVYLHLSKNSFFKKMTNPYLQKEDCDVWESLCEGNLQALEALYRRYYALLLNYGIKCCSDSELVRECIQELFVKLAKSSHISYTESPRAYLLKALRNMINDKRTSASIKSERFSFDDEIFAETLSDDFSDDIFGRSDDEIHMRKALIHAISSLTPQQKHILYLRYIKGLSHREVADVMNMNIQSSMNLLSRSLSKLRKILTAKSISLISFLRLASELIN